MRVRCFVVLLALLLVPVFSAARDWVAYTSEHFTVYSDSTEREAFEVLENFELFRATVLATLNLPNEPESERLMVVMYDRPREFQRISPPNYAGFFYHSIYGPRMIVGPQRGAEATQNVLFHEYVHYLMSRHSTLNYPRWYMEGLAEVLSQAEINASSIVVGKPINRPDIHNLHASIREIIDMEPDADLRSFYYTSWLMTHYFVIDSYDSPERRRQLLEYLRRFDQGEDPIEAFAESFGASPEEIQPEIHGYGRRRTYTMLTVPRPEGTRRPTRRVLSEAEALYLRADLAVELGRYDSAYEYLDRLSTFETDDEIATKAASRRAIGLAHEERFDEGDALMERLLDSGTEDPDVLADIAHYAYDRFVAAQEHGSREAAEGYLARSISYGRRAVVGNPKDMEALYYLGLSHEQSGNLQAAVDALLEAYDMNPSVPRINLNLARMLIKGRQHELASFLVSRLYSASHSEEYRAALLALRRDIENDTVDMSTLREVLP